VVEVISASFSSGRLAALELAHLLQQPAILAAKLGALAASACQVLCKGGHDGAQPLQAIEQVLAIDRLHAQARVGRHVRDHTTAPTPASVCGSSLATASRAMRGSTSSEQRAWRSR
jgi:hypothetical protein